MKCPLSLPEADLVPENLDAAVARGRASVFGSLPYSPTELETVRLVAEKITEASRLGFEQVEIPDTRLSDQFTKTLTDRGFHVRVRHKARHGAQVDPYYKDPISKQYRTRVTASYDIQRVLFISWEEGEVPQELTREQVADEAKLEKNKRQAKMDEDFAYLQKPEEPKVTQYVLEPSPPRSGCLAILLIPLGLVAAIITTNI